MRQIIRAAGMGVLLTVCLAAPLRAQILRGVVQESLTARTLAGVAVRLLDSTGAEVAETVSDGAGGFSLEAPAAGIYTLEGRYLRGEPYQSDPVELRAGEVTRAIFSIPPVAFLLDPVTVEVERRSLALERVGFYQRERSTTGIHMDAEEIARRRPFQALDLLTAIPGIRIPNSAQPGEGYVFLRTPTGVCIPKITLDGMVMQTGMEGSIRDMADLNRLVNASHIIGLELYRRPVQVPANLQGPNSNCGVLAIWTDQGLG